MRDVEKFIGCLVGGAIGDALGYPVEYMSEKEIVEKYGVDGISRYDQKGLISDETQMTLFTAAGLLNGITIMMNTELRAPLEDFIKMNYLNWFETQNDGTIGDGCTWLSDIEELYERRAPGSICLSALRTGAYGTLDNPINNSKGSGAITRVAPIGLYFSDQGQSYERVASLGARVAALTHGHQLGYISSAAFVHIIHKLSQDDVSILDAVRSSIDLAEDMFVHAKYLGEFITLMEKAISLSNSNINDQDAIHQLGEGWVAEEALAISVYCALKYPKDYEKAIISAVNHKGDSDATGSITGNIMGTKLGFSNLPKHFIEDLELIDLMFELGKDLYLDIQIDMESPDQDKIWLSKYMRDKNQIQ